MCFENNIELIVHSSRVIFRLCIELNLGRESLKEGSAVDKSKTANAEKLMLE